MTIKLDLFHDGFVANTQKRIWDPVESLRWLGKRWDLKDNLLTVPEDKINKLLVSIDNALSQSNLRARQLASVTGSIISNMLVFGNVCKLMTKSLTGHLTIERGGSLELIWIPVLTFLVVFLVYKVDIHLPQSLPT